MNYDLVGIGNALVDIEVQVSEDLVKKLDVTKHLQFMNWKLMILQRLEAVRVRENLLNLRKILIN